METSPSESSSKQLGALDVEVRLWHCNNGKGLCV